MSSYTEEHIIHVDVLEKSPTNMDEQYRQEQMRYQYDLGYAKGQNEAQLAHITAFMEAKAEAEAKANAIWYNKIAKWCNKVRDALSCCFCNIYI
jgi:hypothetical protein